jgi:hypothetical protein
MTPDASRAVGPLSARRLAPIVVVLAAALAGTSALACTSASALVTHKYEPVLSTTLNENGAKGDTYNLQADSGHLWTWNGLIDEYDASTGAPIPPPVGQEENGVSKGLYTQFGIAHANEKEQIYTPASSPSGLALAVYGRSEGLLGVWTGASTPNKSFVVSEGQQIGSIGGPAADNSTSMGDPARGDVYVPTYTSYYYNRPEYDVVYVFEPQANGQEPAAPVATLTGTCETPSSCSGVEAFSRPYEVEVSALNGDVYVVDGREKIDVFEPLPLHQYRFLRQLSGPPPTDAFGGIEEIALDNGVGQGAGDLYVAESYGDRISEFNEEGQFLGYISNLQLEYGVHGVAVDSEDHEVFVGSGNVAAYSPNVVIPDVVSKPASEVEPLSAQVNGEVNADNEGEASCVLKWGPSKAFGEEQRCTEKVSGGSFTPVHATVSGLTPDSKYFYRLEAENANGKNEGEESQDQEFVTAGPGMHGDSVAYVASTSATLDARIDPHGATSTYHFQYGTSTEYEKQIPAVAEAIGAGQEDVEVENHLQGLAPNTVYHYRVVVESKIEVKPGTFEVQTFVEPDQTFVTQPVGTAFSLPDGRQWELVSPVDKHGTVIAPSGDSVGVQEAAASGAAMTYSASLPTEENPAGFAYSEQVLSTRGAGGWSSRDISPPHAEATGLPNHKDYLAVSDDLSLSLMEPTGPFTSLAPEVFPLDTEITPYLRHNSTCQSEPATCFQPLVTGAEGYADVPPGTKFGAEAFGVEFRGASGDLRHVVLQSTAQLTSLGGDLTEWSAGEPPAEELKPVSVVGEPGNESAVGDAELGFQNTVMRNAVSANGSMVVWMDFDGKHLYLRDLALGRTVQLDAPEAACAAAKTCGEREADPIYQAASADGTRVFFTDPQHLTSDAGGHGVFETDLYECEITVTEGKPACTIHDLTPVENGENAKVQFTIAGVSEDGSWVYFAAAGVLGETAKEGALPGICTTQPAPSGKCVNLYVRHDGPAGWEPPRLVALLSADDSPDWNGGGWATDHLTARVTPNGEWLTFMSDRNLTAYNNHDAVSGVPDEEVYLYHANASGPGKLVCASCNPTGARPSGVNGEEINQHSALEQVGNIWGGEHEDHWLAAAIPGWDRYGGFDDSIYQSRYLSNDGRLFFESPVSLVPQDVNGAWDVYEFEPAGIGSCTAHAASFSEASGGCLGLISSGRSPHESAFEDASEDGSDVFFLTAEKLTLEDIDTSVDLYDAHVCTSMLPCPNEPAPTLECTTADACRAAPAPQPAIFGAPASATFIGPGNPVAESPPSIVKGANKGAAKCGKGRVRKKGRCVRATRSKRSRKASHHGRAR